MKTTVEILKADSPITRVELINALRDAIEGFKDCAQYKGDYLREKHGDDKEIAALEAVLSKAISSAEEKAQ